MAKKSRVSSKQKWGKGCQRENTFFSAPVLEPVLRGRKANPTQKTQTG